VAPHTTRTDGGMSRGDTLSLFKRRGECVSSRCWWESVRERARYLCVCPLTPVGRQPLNQGRSPAVASLAEHHAPPKACAIESERGTKQNVTTQRGHTSATARHVCSYANVSAVVMSQVPTETQQARRQRRLRSREQSARPNAT
jgi:hypothetical protein